MTIEGDHAMGDVRLIGYELRYEPACVRLINSLPEWFGLPEANAEYVKNLAIFPSWLAILQSKVAGAATLKPELPGAFEIHFLAVDPRLHRKGIGRRLVEKLEEEAGRQNGKWIHVKTLSASHPDQNYKKTRAFYHALGYEPLLESNAIWGPENPAVILVKRLSQ